MTFYIFLEYSSLNCFSSLKSTYFSATISTDRAILLKKYLSRSKFSALRTSFAISLPCTCSRNYTFLMLNILCSSIDSEDSVDYASPSSVKILSLNSGCRLIYTIVILWLGLITNIFEKKWRRVFSSFSPRDLFFFLMSWRCISRIRSYPSAHLFSISFSKLSPLKG
jgi:hypothetical protein